MERQGRHGYERDGGVRRQRDDWLVRAGSSTPRAWVREGPAEMEAGMQGRTAREKKVEKNERIGGRKKKKKRVIQLSGGASGEVARTKEQR